MDCFHGLLSITFNSNHLLLVIFKIIALITKIIIPKRIKNKSNLKSVILHRVMCYPDFPPPQRGVIIPCNPEEYTVTNIHPECITVDLLSHIHGITKSKVPVCKKMTPPSSSPRPGAPRRAVHDSTATLSGRREPSSSTNEIYRCVAGRLYYVIYKGL